MIEDFGEKFEGGEVGRVTSRLYQELADALSTTHNLSQVVNGNPVVGSISIRSRIPGEETNGTWLEFRNYLVHLCQEYQTESLTVAPAFATKTKSILITITKN